jgi:hypothetical protein
MGFHFLTLAPCRAIGNVVIKTSPEFEDNIVSFIPEPQLRIRERQHWRRYKKFCSPILPAFSTISEAWNAHQSPAVGQYANSKSKAPTI